MFDRTRRPQVPDAQVAFGLRRADGFEAVDEFANVDMRLQRRTRPRIERPLVF